MYVFLGLLYNKEDEERLAKTSKVGLQAAANNYQWGLIRGLFKKTGEKTYVINSVPMGVFPQNSTTLVEKKHHSSVEEAEIENCGYVNLPVIKQFQRTWSAYRRLSRLTKQSAEPVTVVVYSLYGPYLRAIKKAKRKHKNFKCILVVPDLPGVYGIESTNPLLKLVQRIRGKSSLKLSQYADGYVLLTEQMAEPLKIAEKDYVIIEGIANENIERISTYKRERVPMILYTGAIEESLGMKILLEAFEALPVGLAKLCVAGAGSYTHTLKDAAKTNPNIEYLGYLPKQRIHQLQREAAILVNPRSAEDAYTKYSFPSKTMEYLSTGVPVVMNALPGIPNEYHTHLFLAESSDANSMAKMLKTVLTADENVLLEHGYRGAEFVKSQKSSGPQAAKLLELAEMLMRK